MLVNEVGDRSIDAGVTWRLAGADYIVAHVFTDGSLLVADGAWTIIGVTTDFVAFAAFNAPPTAGENYIVQTIPGTDVVHVDDYSGTYYLSLDAGATWTATQNLMGGLYAQCQDGSVIAAIGGVLNRTTDGGGTFTPVSVPPGYFGKIAGVIGNRLVATNYSSTMKYSDDFGASWQDIVLPSAVQADVPLVTSGGITLCDNGRFISTDSGATFQATGNGPRSRIYPALGGGFYGVDEGSLAFGKTMDGLVWADFGVVIGKFFDVPGTTLPSFDGRAVFVIDGYYATDDNSLVNVPSREMVAKSGSSYFGLCDYGFCRSDNGVDWNTVPDVALSSNGVDWLVSDAASVYYSDGVSLFSSSALNVSFTAVSTWSALASLLSGNGVIVDVSMRSMYVSGGDLYLVLGNTADNKAYFVRVNQSGAIIAQSPLDGSSYTSMIVEYDGSIRCYTRGEEVQDLFVVAHGQTKQYVMTTWSYRVFGTTRGIVLFTNNLMYASHDFVTFTQISEFQGLPDFCAMNSSGCEMIISKNAIQM